ncbi:diphthine methyl ester synthase isoform X1 [Panthera pardus]|uniref:diphthine methyl ester synthase n=2 Tax=Pantherinae TaxID=338153 RepID=A0A9V1G1A5_PANPR|nr:diphthine methyl ester synthase isoform X1 [Panthera pardus]XP_019313190.1 diphthine methyl ester synthase isoform X1 [Panthera pardus]XP_060479131.1 diphthine methyl ester synthase isoform X1 [Panthera onca]XP_060479132.1 diphthine methyl ester synthase isoform X1 [Panthera onca]
MLYLIGLGLGDAKDITVKGLEVVRRCSRVYLEAYTSILTVGKEVLEEFYGRKLILADREEVEQEADNILKDADICDVAFLVVGDPFGATTHSDLILRATKLGISYRVIHNASIMNAVGCCGLQLYKFGETVSIVFWTDTWRPESFFDKVKKNRQNGMHTLCLLDIKVKEQSLENLIKGRKIYEPPRYMSVNQAARQLLEIVQNQRIRGEEPGEDSMNLVESHSWKAEKSEQSLLLCIARENSFEFESRQVRRLVTLVLWKGSSGFHQLQRRHSDAWRPIV